jgi:hypothetical protein
MEHSNIKKKRCLVTLIIGPTQGIVRPNSNTEWHFPHQFRSSRSTDTRTRIRGRRPPEQEKVAVLLKGCIQVVVAAVAGQAALLGVAAELLRLSLVQAGQRRLRLRWLEDEQEEEILSTWAGGHRLSQSPHPSPGTFPTATVAPFNCEWLFQ